MTEGLVELDGTTRYLTDFRQIALLLESAAASPGVVILSRGALRCFRGTPHSPINGLARLLGETGSSAASTECVDILGSDPTDRLGDAPAWIDAGALYEGLLTHSIGEGGYVFCLDPWAAQLKSRMGEVAPGARWVLISDLRSRKASTSADYWTESERWFQSLPFHAFVEQGLWDKVVAELAGSTKPSSEPPARGNLFRAVPGAWRWEAFRTAHRQPIRNSRSILFVTKFAGSVLKFRPFVDSVVRQDLALESVALLVIVSCETLELSEYLAWCSVAFPKLQLSILEAKTGAKAELLTTLAEHFRRESGASVVAVQDTILLPKHFASSVLRARSGDSGFCVPSVALPPELSAHIIVGNLDPEAHYTDLLNASQSKRSEVHSEKAMIGAQILALAPSDDESLTALAAATFLGLLATKPRDVSPKAAEEVKELRCLLSLGNLP